MTTKSVNSLPLEATASANDVVILVVNGNYYRTTAAGLANAMALATTSTKGLMAASDKINLAAAMESISNLASPANASLASSTSIALPSGRYHITLTGTTEVTAVTGTVARKTYVFSYPTGAGLTFMGEQLVAGDAIQVVWE